MDTFPPSLKTKGSVGQLALKGGNVLYLGVSSADYTGCRGLDQVWRIVLNPDTRFKTVWEYPYEDSKQSCFIFN